MIGQEKAKKELEKAELKAKQALMIPNMTDGQSFLEGEEADLYEGLAPKEINELLFRVELESGSRSYRAFRRPSGSFDGSSGGDGGISSGSIGFSGSRGSSISGITFADDDPYEGMSPEEIDAMIAKQKKATA